MLDWNSLIDDRAKISNLLVVPNVEVSNIVHQYNPSSKIHSTDIVEWLNSGCLTR